ncbi:putative periplasmic serine endoprotease DegP-like precursor [Thalassoglobus neptunius]|uniref:Putative periplasmic serine endoprotease DegP-like n=1 Tax=Thalassoglobus neptunius TaxID=1938619 RepID=A0A5C5X7E8_9PLAN|nr:putative periplasmic serine endoprotease DegP-like precursor [Thalassoglobus neptunius]
MMLNSKQCSVSRSRKHLSALHLMILAVLLFVPGAVTFGQGVAREEQLAIQQAMAYVNPSIVRIETVGGVDLVGDLLVGTGPTSGVVVREDGYIITSRFNFVADPASVLVTTADGERYAAEVVATDFSKMLTLLKIERDDLQPLQSVPVDDMHVGQRAIALGRTFDPEFPNVSVGIISALKRIRGKALQTDAKTSPVNYGGALINLKGECLGIIVPLSSQRDEETAGVELYDSGIGFAIPLADIERVVDQMIDGEDLHAGLLGIGFEAEGPVSGEAEIVRVRPRSPADSAGLVKGDVVTEIDGVPIRRVNDLKQVLGNRYAGETVNVTIRRADESIQTMVTLTDELVAYQFPSLGILPSRSTNRTQAGVGLRFVFPESSAAKAGLQAGDIITSFQSEPVETTSDISSLLSKFEIGDTIELEVVRDSDSLKLPITLEEFPDGDNLPNIPPPVLTAGNRTEEIEVGRFNQKLPGDDRQFWVLVPQDYHPEQQHGLLLWTHPAGDTMEAEIVRSWRDLASERGLILVGVRAEDVSGFSQTDEEYAKDVVEWVTQNYAIDPARVAVMGAEDSGPFATQLAFKYRELFRGLLAIDAPLRFPPPDSNPESRLLIGFVVGPESRSREQITKSVEILREREFPTALIENTEPEMFSFDVVDLMAQWLDALDRL